MNEISEKIDKVNQQGEGAFIPYLMAGDPTPKKSLDYIRALEAGGADLIELGVPFSDPVADGPTIQAAGNRALESTDSLEDVFNIVRKAVQQVEVPIILMSYYNPITQFGEANFLKECRESGTKGVIMPDLPPEEGNGFIESAKNNTIGTPMLATPGTEEERLREIAGKATGFLYLVARPGTTGAKSEVGEVTTRAIERVKPRVPEELPVCVGFGLSSPDQVGQVIQAGADGAIVGSAIVDRVRSGDEPEKLEEFVGELKEGAKAKIRA
jgi:tryptophan synthase alpha chain